MPLFILSEVPTERTLFSHKMVDSITFLIGYSTFMPYAVIYIDQWFQSFLNLHVQERVPLIWFQPEVIPLSLLLSTAVCIVSPEPTELRMNDTKNLHISLLPPITNRISS